MKKLKLKTEDLTKENIEKLGALFPEILTEKEVDDLDDDDNPKLDKKGVVIKKIIKTINVRALKDMIGDISKEKYIYQLTWAGKQNARRVATEPTTKTLKPIINDSEDFENTENLYIEGDNLEVLKILRKSYTNSIKMIYIDPPYNTGKNFVYKDNFSMSKEDYETEAGLIDEEGNRMKVNNGTDGRYHSNWLNMMYPRLQLAHKLLRKDGVIFISIDDNEVDNLRKICDEIFGESNVDIMVWRKSGDGRDGKMKNTETFRKDHEYVMVCFKNIQKLNKIIEKPNFKGEYSNPDNDHRGNWLSGSISRSDDASNPESTKYYTVKSPSGKEITRQFEIPKDEFERLDADKRISWGSKGDAIPRIKTFINEDRSITPYSILLSKGTTTEGKEELRGLFNIRDKKDIFDNPKPAELMRTLTQIATEKDSIILDFFAGSSSLVHGVLLQNAKDNGNRKYIMVQLPEETDESSEAYKAGYKNICEIGKERIRRAAKKIKEEQVEKAKQTKLIEDKSLNYKQDFGFRVFKLSDSIYKDTILHPGKVTQENLKDFEESIKSGTPEEDVLYSVLISMGIPISAKVEIKTINDKKVFVVSDGLLVACFDKNIDLDLVKELAKIKTSVDKLKQRFVFKESSIKGDSEMMGIMDYLRSQVFKTKEDLKDNVKVI